jgi:hypothetical protein
MVLNGRLQQPVCSKYQISITQRRASELAPRYLAWHGTQVYGGVFGMPYEINQHLCVWEDNQQEWQVGFVLRVPNAPR